MTGPRLRRAGDGWRVCFPDRAAFAEGLARAQEESWLGDLQVDATARELGLGPTPEALRAGDLGTWEARLARILGL